jgi:predicted nucleic acid-binding protein
VTVYLDASFVVALITKDVFSERAERFLSTEMPALILSDYAAAEFASVVARRARTKELTKAGARAAFAALDQWALRATTRVETMAADVAAGSAFVRRLDLPLRMPDALNIAIARRMAATLATFDVQMASNAAVLGVAVAKI